MSINSAYQRIISALHPPSLTSLTCTHGKTMSPKFNIEHRLKKLAVGAGVQTGLGESSLGVQFHVLLSNSMVSLW